MADTKLPDVQAAYALLWDQIHVPVFFQKLASYGFSPENAQQAGSLLGLAAKLRSVGASPAAEKFAAANDPFGQASNELDSVLAKLGLDGGVKSAQAAEERAARSELAAAFAAESDVYNSVLSLKAAEAAQAEQQLASA